MTRDILGTFEVKGSKVKVTAWRNDGENVLIYQQLSGVFFRFTHFCYNVWSRDLRCRPTTVVESQMSRFKVTA